MIRKIIQIDQEKCNGCGACVTACHEGAIAMVNGKAVLVREDYCDGLGDCLPACPTKAITFIVRKAAEYDEQAVQANLKAATASTSHAHVGCPGSQVRQLREELARTENAPHTHAGCPGARARQLHHEPTATQNASHPRTNAQSQLMQWPCQIQLVPVNAPYFNNAHLLIAADCTAFAYAGIHEDFMKNSITLIGCPKLDHADYTEKLTQIIRSNTIQSVSVARMEVPCCSGLQNAVQNALEKSGKQIPYRAICISVDGRILE